MINAASLVDILIPCHYVEILSSKQYAEYMAEKVSKENTAERLSRWGRNINLLGTLAIGGAALAIPGPNVFLATWAGLNAAQAGGFELLRKHSKKKGKKKKS